MSSRELIGWYSYSWACEPFIVSAVGTYVPILLEQFARENAVWVKDYSTPCMEIPNTPNDPGIGPPLPGDDDGPHKCVVPFLGMYIDTSSLALYTFSLSVLLQTVVVISMSGAADRGKFRKKLLIGFAIVGAVVTCGFLFVTAKHYYIAALLAIFSNSAFGAVSVCGNAFLPVLVNEILQSKMSIKGLSNANGITPGGGGHADTADVPVSTDAGTATDVPVNIVTDVNEDDSQATSLLPDNTSYSFSRTKERAQLSNLISGRGVAIGYFAALIVQISTMLLILNLSTKASSRFEASRNTFGIQLAIFFVGIWWLIFQIPIALFLQARPGPPLHHHPSHHNLHITSTSRYGTIFNNRYSSVLETGLDNLSAFYAYIVYGWQTLFATFKEAQQMRDVAIFLLGWFVVSDAATTINSAAILFARAELQMSAPSLAVIGVLTVFSGMFGATTAPRLKGPSGNPINSIVFVILIAAAIPLYGILGFFSQSIGLRHPWEMYVLAAWYGFALGGLNATCRSVFSLLIPKGKETTFFSLFSVTDKGSSIIGPAVTGLITDKTHNIRYTFYFLMVMMLLAAGIFYFLLDLERGRKEAHYLEHVGEEDDENDENDSQDDNQIVSGA